MKHHSDSTPPSRFLCPLTLEIMREPVLSRWGHTYERKAIMEWLEAGNDVCPLTRRQLRPSWLITNKALKKEILEWKRQNGYTADNDETAPPEAFICPLTGQIMNHPVMNRYGANFERRAIIDWFNEGYDFCPVTGKPLKLSSLITNKPLALKIQQWKLNNAYDSKERFVDGDSEEEACVLAALERRNESYACRNVCRTAYNEERMVFSI